MVGERWGVQWGGWERLLYGSVSVETPQCPPAMDRSLQPPASSLQPPAHIFSRSHLDNKKSQILPPNFSLSASTHILCFHTSLLRTCYSI